MNGQPGCLITGSPAFSFIAHQANPNISHEILQFLEKPAVRTNRQGSSSSGRNPPRGKGSMTGCAGPKGILPFLLWFGIGLLFSLFSTVAHADSGTLYVTAENVLSRMKSKQDALLIDVRDRDAFEKLRIPGSIHIAPYSLKTKAFLRNKPLVLVSEGYSDAALELTCRSM